MRRCRKVKFSKIGAKIALANMQAKDKDAKRIYYHAQCKAWHITSQVKKDAPKPSSEDNSPIMGNQEDG